MDATQFRITQLEIAVNVLFAIVAGDRATIEQLVEAQQNTTDALSITAVTMTNAMTLVNNMLEKQT